MNYFHFFFSEPQKRRRFNPLRNLRRIFRRRTVTHADTTTISPSSSIDEPQNSERLCVPAHLLRSPKNTDTATNCGYTNNSLTANSAMLTNSVSVSNGFYVVKQKREHSADSARTNNELVSDMERDMTDYQRSLSEGRLVERCVLCIFFTNLFYSTFLSSIKFIIFCICAGKYIYFMARKFVVKFFFFLFCLS